jgi:hypothetical protein
MPNLEVRLQRDIDRMCRYDTQCDIQLADFVEANGSSVKSVGRF